MSRSFGAVLALLAIAWIALLTAAPLLPVPAAGLMYAIGSLVCHQIAERSFHLDAYQLPICARCFGLYAGGAAATVAAVVARPRRTGASAGSRGAASRMLTARLAPYVVTLLAALPTLITFTLEWGAGWPFSNAARAVAGVPLGAAVAFVVVRAVPTLH